MQAARDLGGQCRATSSDHTARSPLIVGAGPAGLFAACELARHGIMPRVVERRRAPHHEARGTALQPAVLAMLERSGLVASFLAAGAHIRRVRLLGPGQREITTEEFAAAGDRYAFQCSLPQWRTETILRNHLASFGVEVEFGTEATCIVDSPGAVRVTLERGDSNETVTVPYLLDAGGAHSTTRHAMGEPLAGSTYEGRYFVADATIGLPGGHECGRLLVGPTGFVMLSPLPDARMLIFVNRDDDDARDKPPTETELRGLLNARAGVDVGLADLRWISPFAMHQRAVRHLRVGRCFLMGDAAHLSSPLAGEGLNAAFMDAADIAWKLALVLHGAAQPSLLDSYATERGMADHHMLDVTDEVHRNVARLVAACRVGVPDTPPLVDAAAHRAALRRRLMLDVSYAGSALIGEAGVFTGGPAPGERFPFGHLLSGTNHHLVVFGAVSRLDRVRDRWAGLVSVVDGIAAGFDAVACGLPGTGAVLVRPDNVIGFRATPADDAMAAIDAHLERYLVSGCAGVT